MLRIKGIDYENGKKTAVYIETLDGVQKFVAERHGHWIMHDDALFGLSCECSECHIETCGTTPRCPVCGAILEEEISQ